MPEDTLTLFSYFRSSCSWRVRIALHWKHLDFNYKSINLLKSEHTADAYTAVNPNATVPSLVLPTGHILTQSIAILEYLEEVYPERPLLPADPIHRAQVRAIVGIIASDTQPVQNLRVLLYAGAERKMEWGKHFITLGLNAVESYLATTAGTYSVGNQVTLADLCLVPQVYNAYRFNVDMSKYPIISRIYSTLSDLDEFKQAIPGNQIDVPEELKGKV